MQGVFIPRANHYSSANNEEEQVKIHFFIKFGLECLNCFKYVIPLFYTGCHMLRKMLS